MEQEMSKVDALVRKFQKRMVISLKESSWAEAGQTLEFAVLLKRVSGRPIKKKILTEILIGVWKVEEKPTFQNVESNTLLVNFKSEKDMERVMEGGPWSFEGEALVLQKWEEGMTADDFSNTKINIFVQMFGLPFELRKDESARGVVEQIGVVKAHKSNGSLRRSAYGKEFLRYRIEIDTRSPIIPGFYLERRGRNPTWINLKYERLPNVCYNCGTMTHETRLCTQGRDELKTEFGAWLKAEDRTEYILDWSVNKASAGDREEQITQTPMCVDSMQQEIEQYKDLQLISYLWKGDMKDGEDKAKVQKQSYVEKAGIQRSDEVEFDTIIKERDSSGPGLVIREGKGEKKELTGPRINEVKNKQAQRKRGLEELRIEEGNLDKKKRADGNYQGHRDEGRKEMEQEVVGGFQKFDFEAECAEHLRREQ